MNIFAFEPSEYRDRYRRDGWVHIPGGMTPEFLAYLQEFAHRSLEATRLEAFAIKGKKEQSIFDFPDTVEYPNELFDVVAEVCGLDRERMTLSERHIQAYEANADPEPAPHKDRFGSQVSVGFSVVVPEGSKLVLYPDDCLDVNPFNSSKTYYKSLPPDRLPSVALAGAREVEIADRPGDVVMFHGSTTWHLRRNSANAINLYVKFNDFACDPLGEDPATPMLEDATRRALEAGDERSRLVPRVSRRLDTISREYTRDAWREVLWATVFGEEPFTISEEQLALVQAADGTRSWRAVTAAAANGHQAESLDDALADLVRHGVLDLQAATT
jgi:hypothetical protein